MTEPTKEQIAAADAIDTTRYEGHTAFPWRWSFMGGMFSLNTPNRGRLIILDWFKGSFRFARRTDHDKGGIMHPVSDREKALEFPDAMLIEDAGLLPVVVWQRDQAQAERDDARRRVAEARELATEIIAEASADMKVCLMDSAAWGHADGRIEAAKKVISALAELSKEKP